jgi:hypothetical protein
MNYEPKVIPPEERPGFRSMAKETWLHTDDVHRQRFVVQRGTTGFQIIDTFNDANTVHKDNIATAAEAHEYLRKTKTR